MPSIEIKNINHFFIRPGRAKERFAALTQVSFGVEQGEIFGLLGPNGGGKTTLFRIISTMIEPSSGDVQVSGVDLRTHPEGIRKKIGVVFQHPSLDKKLTLLENLIYQGHLYGLSGTLLKARVSELTLGLNINNRLADFVEALSGGLQRRGEIAKGLLHKPEVLLMDEPSTGLDPGARRAMWDVLLDLKKTGVTILLTTHLMEEAEKCDRLAILHQGHLVALGTPPELKSRIGGDVITIETKDPSDLSQKIKTKFSVAPRIVEGIVQIEQREGHKFIPQLVEAFPGLIQSIKVGKPTLEDVFAKETGQGFWRDEEEGHE